MKTPLTFYALGLVLLFVLGACKNNRQKFGKEIAFNDESKLAEPKLNLPKKPLSQEFKKYWYAGDAEITSYELKQARYGEIRKGTSVLIYVTEPFLPEKQVKADRNNATNIPVLKLNGTKKYLTGLYPYSIMSSTFYPVYDNQHAIKTSLSMQEWCGHVYSQINNREDFEFMSHSYFQTEADQNFNLEKEILENEIWTKIRINPTDLPTGNFKMIPSLEYIRLRHVEMKAYDVSASLSEKDGLTTYSISYPQLRRSLSISFKSNFPFTIESWSEEFRSGFGPNAKTMISSAKKMKSLKTAYWGQNGNDDLVLRDSLGL